MLELNLGLGSIATQDANNVALTGGIIDGVTIGGTTAAAGSFTTLSANAGITGNLTGNVTGNLTGNVTGDLTGNVNGTVSFANSLSSAVTINISSDATGTATFTAAGDQANITLTLANTAVNSWYIRRCYKHPTIYC